jgi:DNA repair ATPase RecN
MDATDVATAINEFRARALRSFNAALTDVDSPPGDTAEKKATALIKAKGEMAAALQQLISADTMASDKRSREGFDAVVTLLEKTKDTADSVYTQITTIARRMSVDPPNTAEQNARTQQITALAAVLEGLANIAAVWKKAP